MAFLDKLGDIARNIGDKTSDVIETQKLNSKISSEKSAISESFRQIGDYYYKKYQAGELSDDGVAELFAAIDAHNQNIADAQAEIERIKAENAAQSAAAAPTQFASPSVATVTCPSCGKPNPVGTKFCADCGTKIEVAVPTERTCPGCGIQVSATARFCGECGYKFE